MNRIIQYAIHTDGFVVSRVGSELAWPILDWDGMLPENGFKAEHYLDRVPVLDVRHEWSLLKWTRKVPISAKNLHRQFWGFPLLKSSQERHMKRKPLYYDCGICGHFHPWDWRGDCREDANRLTYDQLDEKHGIDGFEIRSMADRVEADAYESAFGGSIPHCP